MKEVIRIHLAKIAYDIELDAKKELKDYMGELERYADDPDILQEIELRITELLEERGVVAGGVVSAQDVEAVRSQLGEPKEFAHDEATIAVEEKSEVSSRRLYRDEEEALLGGVLSGVAKYFGIQPIWTRLLFIVLLFVSFGSALIAYVILWIIVPVARSAAEKLALEGKPVTLAAIKERGEQVIKSDGAETAGRAVRQVVLFCLGLVFAGGAVVSFILTLVAGFMLLVGGSYEVELPFVLLESHAWYYIVSIVLFIVSGLLLTALNILLASASFRRSWTKRMSAAVATVVIAGMVTFAGGFLPIGAGSWYGQQTIQKSYKTVQHDLPASFAEARELQLELAGGSSASTPRVAYTVSDEVRYEVSYPKGSAPEIDVEQKGEVAKIVINLAKEDEWQYYYQPTIHLYGPALNAVDMKGGSMQYTNDAPQDAISVKAAAGVNIALEGKYREVRASTQSRANVSLDDATVERLIVATQGGSVDAGVVQYLEVTQPTACPARADDQNSVEVAGVSDRKVLYNGEIMSLSGTRAITQPCGSVEIEDLQDY